MRKWVGVVLTIALVACDKLIAAPPQGPAGDVARIAAAALTPNAEVVDQPFEDVLSQLDLGANAAEIAAQIRKTRSAVAAARATASSSGGYRLASVAHDVGTFSIPHFAHQFAYVLDDLTAKSGTLEYPFRPFTSREEGATTFTTTTLTTTERFEAKGGKGARVEATVRWAYTTITIETRTGATLVHVTDQRDLVGSLEVCPDAGGRVLGTLKVGANITAESGGRTSTRKADGDSEFRGEVDDQAKLTRVRQSSKNDASWKTAAGDGGYSSRSGATWNAGSDGFLGGLDASSITMEVTQTGVASAAEAARAAGWDTVLGAFALDEAFKKAQDLWRHGRCVMVVAPDYNAETPIETFQQEKPQHDESVDTGSETKFSARLKHRFGDTVTAAIQATLSGQKTLEPNRLESSGSLTYKAPDEENKKATATLRSTSKRGIGTLVLEFHTGGALTLRIQGTATTHTAFLGNTVDGTYRVTIGPLELKRTGFGDMLTASGTWQATFRTVASNSLSTQTCDGTEQGTFDVDAQIETRAGNKRVLVIDPASMTSADGSGAMRCQDTLGGTTLRGVTLPREFTADTDGGSATVFLGALDRIVIPMEGGTIQVSGNRSVDRGTISAQGTATAKK